MNPPDVRVVDYRQLMKQVEQVVREIEASAETGDTVHTLANAIIARFRDALGIYAGRLYRRAGEEYQLVTTFPESRALEGFRVPADYAPIDIALSEGIVYMTADDPRLDAEIEAKLGVEGFAAIVVGEEEFLLAFDIAPGIHRDDVLFSLGVLRHSINQKLRQERMAEVLTQARKIQVDE